MLFYQKTPVKVEEKTTIKVTATFYPLAYFAEAIGGERVEVSSLIPYNSEVHSWQPSISDIAGLEDSDIIIYMGAGLEPWIDDLLETIDTSGKTVLEASSGIPLISIPREGSYSREVYDPHLWVCPYTGLQIAENIYNTLKTLDPENEEYYQKNWAELETALTSLDQRYMETLEPAAGKTFFTTHSAYGYIADRYGLEQHSVIGLSADEQPSTFTLAKIIDLMLAEDSYVVYIDPIYSDEYAQTLKAELESRSGKEVSILRLYLMLGPVDGLDYLGQLEANLNNLKRGLVN